MLSARANALLRARRPGVLARLAAREDVLELDHPRVGEEKGRVLRGDERRGADAAVPTLLEEAKKALADLFGLHLVSADRSSQKSSLPRIPAAGARRGPPAAARARAFLREFSRPSPTHGRERFLPARAPARRALLRRSPSRIRGPRVPARAGASPYRAPRWRTAERAAARSSRTPSRSSRSSAAPTASGSKPRSPSARRSSSRPRARMARSASARSRACAGEERSGGTLRPIFYRPGMAWLEKSKGDSSSTTGW